MNPVCLITPPSPFLLDQRVFVSLGILRVAAVLEQNGVPVEHLDLSGISNYVEAITDHVRRSEATVFGLTATTPQMPAAMEIRAAIREARPDARLILGGPHVTLVNAARKRETTPGRASVALDGLCQAFDTLVCGDGEDAICTAIWHHAPKVIDADDVRSDMFLTNERYDQMPLPARHLVDMPSYHYQIEGRPSTSLIAQLGCPYMCSFCGGRHSAMLRRIRTRSTANIVAEMVHLYETYGYTGFMLYDDELNVNREMIDLMEAIAEAQQRLGVEWRLRGFVKSNLFTASQAVAMYKAGFRWVLVGFESGSERILRNINKKATAAQNTECRRIAHDFGLQVKALMSLGHAGESPETISETRQWLLDNRPDDFDVAVITTYPGTPYYDEAVRHIHLPDVWTYTCPKSGDQLHAYDVDFTQHQAFYKGMQGAYRSFVFTDHVSAEELVRLRDDIERDVRHALDIPYPSSAAAVHYEHSMGQALPAHILQRTTAREAVA